MLVDHDRVADCPDVIEVGLDEKDVMAGVPAAPTLTLLVCIGLLPPDPVHCIPVVYVPAEEGVMESEPLVPYEPP